MTVPCPSCGARVPWSVFRAIFDCPECGATLRVHSAYMFGVWIAGVLLATAVVYVASGFSRTTPDSTFAVPLMIASLFVALVVAVRFVSPEIEQLSARSSVLPLGAVKPDAGGVRLQRQQYTCLTTAGRVS